MPAFNELIIERDAVLDAMLRWLRRRPQRLKGKALLGEFFGYRSIRAVGQRYRIIYQVKDAEVIVMVVSVGIRKQGSKEDIYSLAKKLIKLHMIGKK